MREMTHRLRRQKASLVVVDIQERLLPAIFEKERVIRNARRLIQGASILNILILITEQYRKGLGQTVPEIAEIIPSCSPLEKLSFSACGANGFLNQLAEKGLTDIIICGIECHVCVCQTSLDLLDLGYRVFVVADAISSRTSENYRIGLERMRHCGASIVSAEMVLYELLEQAGTQEFKQVLSLVK
jgi:nicotinamidase-related amidase